MMQILYGPPPSNTINLQPLYGVRTPTNPLSVIITILSSSTFVIFSFVVGTVLFLLTKKKIFLIISLIIFGLFLITRLIGSAIGF